MNYNELWRKLAQIHDEGEAKAIARMVYEVRYGLSWTDLCIGKDTQLSANSQVELEEISQRLLNHEPVQYVLGRADFCGRTFVVNKNVLIPRSETEELCRWIIKEESGERKVEGEKRKEESGCSILDVGTGSGCIAITLAAEMPDAKVSAWDISAEALKVAEENARRAHVHVSFAQVDVLHIPPSTFHSPLSTFHFPPSSFLSLIVSNPPYICHQERAAMEANVLEHEPHTALFVPDDDPLLFYRAIAQFAQTALHPGGWLYFEINPLYAAPLYDLLSTMSYHDIEIQEDQYGKQRMMRARKG